MDRFFKRILVFSAFLFLVSVNYSCNKGTGCLINESAHVKTGKNGKLPKTRGKSRLFPKKFNR